MLTWIREKFGTVVIGIIIGLIAFVFVFYGVFTPDGGPSAYAGKVNGETITLSEYNRSLRQRTEFFKGLLGNSPNFEEQLKNFRIKQAVFDDLVRRKLMVQEAERQGLMPADEQIRTKIKEMDVFKEGGNFDVMKYRQVLAANNYTPESFERLMREDLAAEQWSDHFRRRTQVSETEMRREFELANNKRDIKYVLLTPEAGRKGVKVSDEEVKKYLEDAGKANIVKNQFESRKDTEYKGKTLDQVKTEIARGIIAGEKSDEVRKVNEKLAEQVVGTLAADKASDARVNAMLKPYGVEVKSTGMVTRQSGFLPGIGEAKELMADAFAEKSPIDPAQGGRAKKYVSANWVLVAVVSDRQRADLAKLESERSKLMAQIASRKERELMDGWMKKLMEKADIEAQESVVSDA